MHKDFDVLIKKTWCNQFQGSRMFCLVKKMKLLKVKAKDWNRKKFGNIFRQIAEVDSQLQYVQNLLVQSPVSPNLALRQDRLLSKRRDLFAFQSCYWKQKSRDDFWLKGDSNTSYYHATASIRKNRNIIKRYKSNDGDVFTIPSLIEEAISLDFKKRFESNTECWFDENSDFELINPIISDDENRELTEEVTADEIKTTIFDLAPDIAPGPDGFPPFFFQKYWQLVGNSVIRAVQAFFHSGHMLNAINHTFITLIPKSYNPESAKNFRPISLCSTIYKVIAKVLTNRLKVILGNIIHPLQGAFILERIIQDNILLAHEVFHSFKNKGGKEGWLAIKLDMEKAYDRIEWNYLLVTLSKLGFHTTFIDWIKSCIATVSFSVLVNGIPGRQFTPSRGLRQGDPLSPYLFILCAELLARKVHKASFADSKDLGVKIGRSGIKVPFLTFADDTLLFAKANTRACVVIKSILDHYCRMSGQLVNFHKSSFQCSSNVAIHDCLVFKDILGMDHTLSLGKYLGCPVITERVTKETFGDVVDKTQKQLGKWKANSLSQMGRAVLI